MCLNASKLIFEPLIYGHLSAILNFQYFSKCSRVRFRIPAVIHYVGHKDMETTEKKTISGGAGYTCMATRPTLLGILDISKPITITISCEQAISYRGRTINKLIEI